MLTWTATSGTGPYTVIYNDGTADRTENGVVSGTPFAVFTTPVTSTTTYTLVSVEDATTCIRSAGFTVGAATITVNPQPQGSLTANGPFCGTGAGMLTWTATSGTGPYTVIYNDGTADRTENGVVSGTPFAVFTTPVTSTTTYTLVSVEDATTCIRSAGFTVGAATITVNPQPQGSLTSNGPFCGTGAGMLTWTATSGTGPYTVIYNDGTADRTENGVVSGTPFAVFTTPVTSTTTYTLVSVEDATTCIRSAGFTVGAATITVNPQPQGSLTSNGPFCGTGAGMLTWTATSGTGPYTVIYNDGTADRTESGVVSGTPFAVFTTPVTSTTTYTLVSVEDATTCIRSAGFTGGAATITVNPQPQGSLTSNGPFCGTGAGMLTWTATSGTGPYTVIYNDGTADRTESGVVSGTPFAVFTTPVTSTTTYTLVSVEDATTCIRSAGFTVGAATITVNPQPQGSLTSNGPFCGAGAGMLTWTATSGTGPYTVIYNDGTADRTENGVVSGTPFAVFTTPVTSTTTYTLVSVEDATTCIRSAGFTVGAATITVNPQPQGSLTSNGPFCGAGAGMLTWTATSGTGPYTVIYNDGTADRTENGVVSGTPFAVFTTPVTSTTTYTLVSVEDATTCIRSAGFTVGAATITVNPQPQGSLTSNGPFCGAGAGMLTWTATSGTGPYTVIYNDGTADRTENGVVSGTPFAVFTTPVTSTTTYTLVSVEDATTCIRSAGFTVGAATITVNPQPQGSLTANGPFCGTGAGMLTWTATSGTGPYTVIYNDGTADRTESGVVSGTPFAVFTTPVTSTTTYTLVSVEDATTCIRSAGFTVGAATITVNPLPTQPGVFTDSDATVCQGEGGVLYTVPNDLTVTYSWSYDGADATINGTGNSVTVDFSTTATSGTLSVEATNGCGTSAARTIDITVNPLPAQPGAFTASEASVCQGENGVEYTVPLDATVSYNWNYDGTGATINGSSNSITVDFSITATAGTLSVTATNGCGTSSARTIDITINPLPAQPGAFTAFTTPVCQGESGVIYTVPNDLAASGYTWSYSGTGAIINGTTNSVTVDFSATATSGTLSVTADNGCGSSLARTIDITVNPQPQGSLTSNGPFCGTGAGMLTWTATSGTGPYTVIYNDGTADRTENGVVSGTPFAVFTTPVTSTTTYTLVSVEDATTCIRSAGFTGGAATITVNPQPQGSLTANGPFCGTGAGMLTWTATSGTGPYTVIYNDGTADRTASGVVSGTPFAVFTTPVTSTTTYTLVSVEDATTCMRNAGFTGGTTTITVNQEVQGSLTSNGPFCGTGAGMLTWTATSGTGPYTVIYNDGTADRTESGVVSGTPFAVFTTPVGSTTTYTLISVSDAGSCSRNAGFTGGTATITVNPQPQGSLTANGPFCITGAGMLTWTATSGTGPFTVVYNDGTADRTENGVVSGTPFAVFTTPVASTTTYTLVSVTDETTTCIRNAGFTGNTATITVNTVPTVTITDPVPICAPLTVDLTAPAVTSGSTAGLTYTYWTDASATIVLTGETAVGVTGTYYIKGTDPATTCYSMQPVAVIINALPTVTITNPASVCDPSTVDLTAGAVTLGSTAGLTYTYWTDAAATIALAGESAVAVSGTYYIKGTDPVTSCFSIQPVTVTINPLLPVSVSITANSNPVCSGATIQFTATPTNQGTSPLYQWFNGATPVGTNSSTYSYVPADGESITVMLTSSETCQSGGPATSNIITTDVNPVINVSAVPTHILCNGASTGEISITVTGGTAPYSFAWTGTVVNPTSEDQTGLTASNYSVTVTDASSCSVSANSVINQPTAVTGSVVSQNNIIVYGETNGSVEVAGSGGTQPYQYSLGSGAFQPSGSFGTLSAGDYTITIQDANMCTSQVSVTITQPSGPLSGSVTNQTAVTCFGTSTGTVTVAGSGGLAPYIYSLDGTSWQASGLFETLARGTYTVIVKDAANTTVNVPVTIFSPTEPVGAIISAKSPVLCFGGNTGSTTISGTGGIAPYRYRIDGGDYQTSDSFGNLIAGTHTVTVIDTKLCTFNIDVVIEEPTRLTGSITTLNNVSCYGAGDAEVTAAGSGGVNPYEFSFNGGTYQASGGFTGLLPGNHSITIRDANQCTVNVPVIVTEPDALVITSTVTDILCPDDPSGSISLTITGGTQPYNVIWADGVTGANRTGITDSEYSAVVTDQNGCAGSLTSTVGVIGSEDCLEIPEIITPNGDGYNDTWKIRNIDMFPDAEVVVFNRWGKKVFESRNVLADQWDGTVKGEPLPTDSYHYILDLNNGSKAKTGIISIIK